MPDSTTFALFLVAALVLLLTPGPAVLYIVTRSVDQGRVAGMVSTLGVGAGSLVQVIAAALGVSAVLLSSALAFSAIKYIGAAYLIYLGVRRLSAGSERQELVVDKRASLTSVFWQGVLVNLLNPKTALFFFAFLPQFVDASRGTVPAQMLFLGAVFVSMGICSDGLYALLAGTIGNWLKKRSGLMRAQRYLVGSLLIALGVTAALAGSGKK
jgi:threonine/homoserine/homoserine lactone efflux protein